MRAKKSISTKALILLLAVVLVIGCTAGGTLAWLIAKTDTVTNTFTVGNISIDLTETVNGEPQSAASAAVNNNGFKMIPGTTLSKDPKVTVKANSEACWLFVKVEASNGVVLTDVKNANTYVTYDIADNWSPLENTPGVYYYDHAATGTTDGTPISILKDDQVAIPSTVTKAMMDAVPGENAPTLKFTAYAVQKANGTSTFSAVEAWNIANNPSNY